VNDARRANKFRLKTDTTATRVVIILYCRYLLETIFHKKKDVSPRTRDENQRASDITGKERRGSEGVM